MEPEINKVYVCNGGIILIDETCFTDGVYQNDSLKRKIADVNLEIFSNDGSGTMLSATGTYTYDSDAGTLTMTPGKYKIKLN